MTLTSICTMHIGLIVVDLVSVHLIPCHLLKQFLSLIIPIRRSVFVLMVMKSSVL